MAYRTLELTLISAKDLKEVNMFSKMDIYAVVSFASDPRSSQRTPTDRNGGKSPSWNTTFYFSVPSDPAQAARLVLHVLLRSERALGDRDVGEVYLPVKELLDGEAAASSPRFVSYQVLQPSSGKTKGVLNISYKFLGPAAGAVPEKKAATPPVTYPSSPSASQPASYPPAASYSKPEKAKMQDEPVIAYPTYAPEKKASPPPVAYPASLYAKTAEKAKKHDEPVVAYPASSALYPPPSGYPPYPPQPYGYAARPAGFSYPPPPPPAGYGYPPPLPAGYGYVYGYGYAAPPAKPPKTSGNFGGGLGMGLLGGALGGLLIGDIVSDAGGYDAGYDAGFDDASGFDF